MHQHRMSMLCHSIQLHLPFMWVLLVPTMSMYPMLNCGTDLMAEIGLNTMILLETNGYLVKL